MDAIEAYLDELAQLRASGAALPETSFYPALAALLNAVGAALNPKVRCVSQLRNAGAGVPDFGLFTADQFQRAADLEPLEGAKPARGVVEAKKLADDLDAVARTDQARDYLDAYGLVLLTNYREFALLGRDAYGAPALVERCALADSPTAFWAMAAHPRAAARAYGERIAMFLRRALLHNAPLAAPQDVAWVLASYAREALAALDRAGALPALAALRGAMEQALGIEFQGDKGEHLFRSTLVQTLFYGVFSAWVYWHHEHGGRRQFFDWHSASWLLHVPVIQALFHQLSDPARLRALGLTAYLDRAADALNRVDRAAFFTRFERDHAVQYFYEPFLEAYDPALRKDLGVWYTPPEIVRYMTARVDRVLRDELGLPLGLADPNVYVLDPCCGTGAYLVETLRVIGQTLRANGEEALLAHQLKRAAFERVCGFEIMPAPLTIAHLQLGLLLQEHGAPLDEGERAAVYLTNALTGWGAPSAAQPRQLTLDNMPELRQERDAAQHVKRDAPVLVVLGNPPYNGFAGTGQTEEERALVQPYKEGLIACWGIKKFNLDDLYVRFFRLAERRIAEMSGRGVVCFISNHSWISDPSFVVLRQHLLSTFDRFWIENLHGNRKISEYAPDGRTSETIFAMRGLSAGIQQGVATSLWVKSGKRYPTQVLFRDDLNAAKADERRAQLLDSLSAPDFDAAYQPAAPSAQNRYSFRPAQVGKQYLSWPKVTELCAQAPYNGLMEKRGGALMSLERAALEQRMRMYYDPAVPWESLQALGTGLTEDAARFEAKKARAKVQAAESFQPQNIRRYALRPFETRWCYYSGVRPLWNEPRPTLWAQCWEGNAFLMSRPAGVASPEGVSLYFTRGLGDNDLLRGHAYYFPFRLRGETASNGAGQGSLFGGAAPVANLSPLARAYLARLGVANADDPTPISPHPSRPTGALPLPEGEGAESVRLPLPRGEGAEGVRLPLPRGEGAEGVRLPLPRGEGWGEGSGEVRPYELLWLHALAIGYAPAYLAENAEGLRQDWPRIPLPPTLDGLIASARLGRRVADLLDTETEVAGVTAGVIAPEWRAVAQLTRVGGGQLTPGGDDLAVTAGWGHAGREGVTMPGKGRLAQRRAPDGGALYDIYLNDVAYWRGVPAEAWEYTIGGYQVLKKWLSYREQGVLGRPLTAEEATEFTHIARRLAALAALGPSLDENYRACIG